MQTLDLGAGRINACIKGSGGPFFASLRLSYLLASLAVAASHRSPPLSYTCPSLYMHTLCVSLRIVLDRFNPYTRPAWSPFEILNYICKDIFSKKKIKSHYQSSGDQDIEISLRTTIHHPTLHNWYYRLSAELQPFAKHYGGHKICRGPNPQMPLSGFNML